MRRAGQWQRVLAALAVMAAGRAMAHRDTLTQVLEPDSLTARYEAEALPTRGAAKPMDDPEALGGRAVVLAGPGAGFDLDFGTLPVGIQAVYVAAKVVESNAFVKSYRREVQVGSPTLQSKPLYLELEVNSGPGGAIERHRMRVPFSTDYEYVAKIYFHTPEARRYRGRLTVGERTRIGELVVDRVELRNPLAALTFQAIKRKRILYPDDELANLRQAAGKERRLPTPLRPHPRTAAARAERDAILWNESVMPLNGQTSYYRPAREALESSRAVVESRLGRELGRWIAPRAYDQPWQLANTNLGLVYTMADYTAGRPLPAPWPFPEDKGGCWVEADTYGNALPFNVADISCEIQLRYQRVLAAIGGPGEGLAWRYLLTGDLEAGADGALLLAALAYRFPSYDWQVHNLDHIIPFTRVFEAGSVFGRGGSYQGWSTPEFERVIRAYDMLFPYIQDNAELAERVGRFVPWVKTPDDVVKLIDTFLVQRGAQDAIQQILYSHALPVAAVVLGPHPVSERYLDTYFRKIYFRDTLCGFLDDMVNGYSRDGLNYIGSSYYAVGESIGELMASVDLFRSYVRAGGAPRYNLADPKRHPRLSAMPDAVLRLHVAGGFRPGVGDVMDLQGAPIRAYDAAKHGPFYANAWRWTRDPRYAWLLVHVFGQGALSDAEWTAVCDAAAGQRDPVLHGGSQVLEGFGFATLEEGTASADYRHKNAVMLQTGIGSGHAHCETLNYEVFAHGLRMSSDLGGRASSMYGRPQVMATRVHNLVEVDERSHNGGTAENATGIGWIEAWKPYPEAQLVQASGRAESHPQVSRYSRTLAQIVCDPGNGSNRTPSAYVFDLFRVAGGSVHTWCFHGAVSEAFQCNAPLQSATSATASNYLSRYYPGSQREGVAPDALEAVWKLRRKEETVDGFVFQNAEKKMLGSLYDPAAPEKFTKVTLFGHAGDTVLVGNWWSKMVSGGRFFNFPFLHVRAEGAALSHVYPALVEPYAGEPFVREKRMLAVEGAEPGAEAPVAMRVRTVFGQTDLLFSGIRTDAVYRVEGGARMSGRFGFLSRDAGGVRLAHLVGGSELEDGAFRIRLGRTAYTAEVAAHDDASKTLTLSEPWPARLLDGEILSIGNAAHQTHYASDRIDGRTVTLHRSARVFRGGVESVDAETGYANLDVIPYLFNYHPAYYTGMTALTESGRVLGRAGIRLGERYWYTGWPEVRRHRAVMRPEDVADANGDGKRMLTLIAQQPVKRFGADGTSLETVSPGMPMLDLELTRVREDGLMFWTAQHPRPYLDALKMPHPGWPYDQQVVQNEAGDKRWVVNMPGDVYQLGVEGKRLTDREFDDPDRDGRRLIWLQDFGPGDRVEVPAHVYLRRLEPGRYEVRANAACELSLPVEDAPGGYTWSPDGVDWRPLAARREGPCWVIAFDEAALTGPTWMIRAVRE